MAVPSHTKMLNLLLPMEQTNRELTLRQAQQMVDKWIRTFGVRYFSA